MTYLLQVMTNDFQLQLATEVTACSISELQAKAKAMVQRNPAVVGLKYLIARVSQTSELDYVTKTIKTGTIEG